MKKTPNKFSKEEITAPEGSILWAKQIKETYKNTVSNPIILPDNFYKHLSEHDDIVKLINELKAEKDFIEHNIMLFMKEHDTAYLKDRIVTWKKSTRTTLDTKRLKEEEPEIYEEYSKTSSSRVFKIR